MGTKTTETEGQGATAVITHRVREDRHADYERWLGEIGPLCKASPGHLDWHVVRPIPGVTETYTFIIRFDTEAHLKLWMDSPHRARMISLARPWFVTGDDFFIRSGLDFWFAPGGARTVVPVRWKQALITWSAIYPLVLGVPWIVATAMQGLGLQESHLLSTLVATLAIVLLMVYVVMPRYTRLVRRWLFE